MRIACIASDGTFATDPILAKIASLCMAIGLRVHGVVQMDRAVAPGRKCRMDLVVLPDGPCLQISQDRGIHSRGCRLDADALERSVALTAQRLDRTTELLIINKFGKHEALGRGFRPMIAEAVELQVPVLTAVSPLNREALDHFCGGELVVLPPDPEAVFRWMGGNASRLSSLQELLPENPSSSSADGLFLCSGM